MKHRRTALLLLLAAAFLLTGFGVKKMGVQPRGLVDGSLLTDAGANAIYSLPFFVDPPTLTKYYLSADAGGFLPQGDDTAAGTKAAPWRSLAKIEAAAAAADGDVWFFMDDGDVWESAADFGADGGGTCDWAGTPCFNESTQVNLGDYTGCSDTTGFCVIISDYDLNPRTGPVDSTQTRPVIDCATNSVTIEGHLFGFGGDILDDDGWVGIANIETTGCPILGDDFADIYSVEGAEGAQVGVVLLNNKSFGIQVTGNQMITGHTSWYSTMVALNTECTVTGAALTSECINNQSGTTIAIGRTTLGATANTTGTNTLVKQGGDNSSMFVMGHRLDCNEDGAGAFAAVASQSPPVGYPKIATGARLWRTLVDVHISGCGAGGGATDQGFVTTFNRDDALTSYTSVFRSTFADLGFDAIAHTGVPATNTQFLTLDCNIFNGIDRYVLNYDEDPATSDVFSTTDNYYDDTDNGDSFYFTANRADVAAVQAGAAIPSAALFDMTDLAGDDAWGARAKCQKSFVQTWPMGGYIPSSVLGNRYGDIKGVVLNTTRDSEIGSR